MPRPSLFASAAVLTIAATSVAAQSPPNFSGRWVEVADSASSAGARANLRLDSSATGFLIIEQTDRTLNLTSNVARTATLSYLIERPEVAATVRAKGPFSVIMRGVGRMTVDTTAGTGRLEIRSDDGSLHINATNPTSTLMFGTITLSLDPGGTLRYQLDIPADGSQPAKRVVQRFRRA